MLEIRPLCASDAPDALRLSTQAGWNQLAADWLRLVELWPNGCLGGWLDGRLIATATLASHGQRLAWVGMVLVDELQRKRGYGGAIMDAILAVADERGIETTGLDATEMGRPVYAARGFEECSRINRWTGQGGARAWIASARGVEPVSAEDWDEIAGIDAEATRIDRERLLRHLAGEKGACARMVRGSGRVVSMGCARMGRTAWHIGPVVAKSVDAAVAVVDALIKEGTAAKLGGMMIDVPDGSLLERAIAARGFTISRRLVRMMRPAGKPNLMSGEFVFAGAGFELG